MEYDSGHAAFVLAKEASYAPVEYDSGHAAFVMAKGVSSEPVTFAKQFDLDLSSSDSGRASFLLAKQPTISAVVKSTTICSK